MVNSVINRYLVPSKNRSLFLFGPRGCGKSTFLSKQLFKNNEYVYLDLLDLALQDELLLNLNYFEKIISSPENKDKVIIVDEIQKFPRLLDTIHKLISKEKRLFVLTGSSARRLKQKGTNLLAGRASVYHLFPFSWLELKNNFDLERALNYGLFPEAYLAPTDQDTREYLNSYVHTFLEKEIQAEQWVRKLEPFRKFLLIAGQMNGRIINRAQIAREIGVDDMTVATYFEILEDTLMAIMLPAYHSSVRKSLKQAPKFYMVDMGLSRAISKQLSRKIERGTSEYGVFFEQFVFLEIYKIANYKRLDWNFSYLHTKDGVEIDLVIERPENKNKFLLIEIKSKTRVDESDAKALETLGADLSKKSERILISCDPQEKQLAGTRALYWEKALLEIFSSK